MNFKHFKVREHSALPNMTKRHAEESLEEVGVTKSPASKKARVGDEVEVPARPNGVHSKSDAPFKAVLREINDRYGIDILGAADEEEEELEESAERPASPDLDEERSAISAPSRQNAPLEGYTDLYLDTISRSVLDFDFEKLCSVTLSNINVYACLVCGKYYQGRGPKSHAYFHALEVGHHVYVNMQTKKVYVLPEGYEVKSKSLDDIKFVVDPRLSKEEVGKLDREVRDTWDLAGNKYRPGKYLLRAIMLFVY